MATPSDCRTMRDVMKSVSIRIAVISFWITIAVLAVILFWHVTDITLNAISKLSFLKGQVFYYVIIALSALSIAIGIFMAICCFVTIERENESISITFLVFSVIGFAMPLLGAGLLALISCYFPENAVPETIITLKNYGLTYLMAAISAVMTIGVVMVIANSGSY